MGKERRIELTPEELAVVADMFLCYVEHTDYNEGYILDKRHSLEDRKKRLKLAYDAAYRIKLAQFLFGEAKTIEMEDEDIPWVDNDLQTIWQPSPIADVDRIARIAGLQDYYDKLEKERR